MIGDETVKRIFLFRLEGIANKSSEHVSIGKHYAALVFVYDLDIDAAQIVAEAELKGQGWSEVSIEEKGAFNTGTLDDSESDILKAYQDAVREGVSTLIFSD